MRAFRNPFRFLLNRSALATVVVLACGLVAMVGGSPWAADDQPEPSAMLQKFSKIEASAAIDALLKRHGTSIAAAAEPGLDELFGAPPSAKRLKPFIYSMAVSGDDVVYAQTARTLTTRQIAESLGAFPTIVKRRNLRTGNETVLFQSNSTSVGAIQIEGGAVSIGTSKLSAGRTSLVFDTSVLHATAGASEARVLVTHSGRLSIGRSTVKICGTISALTGATDSGNPLVSTLTGKCDSLGFLTTETREIQGLDTSRQIALPADLLPFGLGPRDLVGDRATFYSPKDSAFGIGDIETGAFTSLWNDLPQTSALATDGTVAFIDPEEDEDEFEDFSHERAPTQSLIIFPQGDANNLIELQTPTSERTQLKFCGPNLYVVKQLKQSAKQRRASRQGRVDGVVGPSQEDLASNSVSVHDRYGALIKDLGKTPAMRTGVVGCSGDALVMIAVRRLNLTELRYQP